MLWTLSLAALAALTRFVTADVEFTAPIGGANFTGGGSLAAAWKDSGEKPALADLLTYELFLCAGGNEEGTYVVVAGLTQVAQTFAVTGNQAAGPIPVGVGANTPENAYFLKIVSVAKTGGTITNFSPRFSLNKMTGTFPASIKTGLASITDTNSPARIDATTNAAAPAGAAEFDVEYTMQTGATRYAPMQKVPASKITKKKASPQYPTSSVPIAKKFLPTPKVQTTVTQSQTFSVQSMENTAKAAPMPSDDMAKFLARWKD